MCNKYTAAMTPDTAQLLAIYERLSPEQKAEALRLLSLLLSGTQVSLPHSAGNPSGFKPAPLKTDAFKGSTVVLSDDFDAHLDFNAVPFEAPNLDPLFNRPYGKRKRWEPGELTGKIKIKMSPDFDEPLEDFKDYM